jgi:endoglucanase
MRLVRRLSTSFLGLSLAATTSCVGRPASAPAATPAPAGASASAANAASTASATNAASTASATAPGAATWPLRRGVNFGNALDAPSEGEWGVVLGAADFTAVKKAGFDHVRLPVRFSAHAAAAPPYTVDRAFFERVDWAIAQALENGLAIIVDFHHYMELMTDPDANRDRFLGIWKQIAERYRGQPDRVSFELLNEPNGALTTDKWNAMSAAALAIVRATNPTRAVVLEGVFWASAKNLRDTLALPSGDPNVIGSFHMYQPMLFTHQGAPWMGPEYQTRGVVFPGPPARPLAPVTGAGAVSWARRWFERYNTAPAADNPSGPSAITEQLDMASSWQAAHHLPVYMGEFGANDESDADSRARWTRATRVEAERRGFDWAYWDDGGSFRALDRATHEWNPSLKAALLD